MEMEWRDLISQPKYKMKIEKDIYIKMRDGIRLAADIYRPDSDEKFPALLAFSPFGKELQALTLTLPPQQRPNPLWDGSIEAGNMNYIVPRGYVHVIADGRGTGYSEGEYCGIGGIGGAAHGKDGYDLVEWIASQDWCNGNVGMIGISIYGMIQMLTAAEQPPHLKAICPGVGWYDVYRLNYHGGILWLMARAAIEGQGGDGGFARGNFKSIMIDKLSPEELKQRIQERLQDPDIRINSNLYNILKYPNQDPIYFDMLLNPHDGPFYWEGEASTKFDQVKVPVFSNTEFGRAWFVEEAIKGHFGVKGPKKLTLRSSPPTAERPFHQYHDEIIRWYDHWLKGIDTGIMDESSIKIFVGGANKWRYTNEWPLPQTKWTKFYLRPRNRLMTEMEPMDTENVPPDGFYQAPPTVTEIVQSVKYKSAPLFEDMEITGPIAFYLYASIDREDTNWMVFLGDIEPSGKINDLSQGYLKASHRALDKSKSKPCQPYHPHTDSEPVVPGRIYEYAIEIGSISHLFQSGHCIMLEIKTIDSPNDPVVMSWAPSSSHIFSSRDTTHRIYRDRTYPSYLLLPVIPRDD